MTKITKEQATNVSQILRQAADELNELHAGEAYECPNNIKIEVLQKILSSLDLYIGKYVNRHNKAGDSYNKIIGFMINWHTSGPWHHLNAEDIHIICDRVKRYNKSYSSLHNELEFYHGEIWSLHEFVIWRDKGELTEDLTAQKEYYQAKSDAKQHHECCFVDKMLVW